MVNPITNSKYLSLKRNDGKPEDQNTFLGCLLRSIEARGKRADFVFTLDKYNGDVQLVSELVIKSV